MSNQPDIATDLDEPSDDAGGTIRIPGENGELVIFGRVLMIERLPDREELGWGIDVILDDPWRSVRYRNRPFTPHDFAGLHAFLNAAMTDLHPEVSVPAFQCESAGLVMTVVSSADLSIQLDVGVLEYLDDPEPDLGGLRINVVRAALGDPVDVAASMAASISDDHEGA